MGRSFVSSLPTECGVYQMMDNHGVVIYVGKAINIKKRVSQYFRANHPDLKTQVLVKHIHHIEPIITASAHEALLLENQLIKRFKPKFNVLLKDDKSYPYIKLTTNEPYPRIIITRIKKNDGATYFGPYTSYGSTKKLRHILQKLFPLRDCKQAIDEITMQKKCIQLDIGQCLGPCVMKDKQTEYAKIVHACMMVLSGNNAEIIDSLKKKMTAYANEKNFESARVLRNNIQYIEGLQSQQMIQLPTNQHYLFIAYAGNDRIHYIICQHYYKKTFVSQTGLYESNLTCTKDAFIHQSLLHMLQHTHSNTLTIICSDQILSTANQLKQTLTAKNIRVHKPVRGAMFDRLTIVSLNAKKSLVNQTTATLKQVNPIRLLQNELFLTEPPTIIIGCDISHFYGQDIVASIVVFKNAAPYKSLYRQFNIQTVIDKSNDTKSIEEAIFRLFNALDYRPNLLLIDGGKGQLNAALRALNHRKIIDVPCIALAKKHEEIYMPNTQSPLRLSHHHPGLTLLRSIRDEAHRFAVMSQRNKRKKHIKSILQDIPGVGEKKMKALYQHFKSFDRLKRSSISELCEVDQINEPLATKIYHFFRH